jgi:beta-lysine 5,6-aminomutase beta subunit
MKKDLSRIRPYGDHFDDGKMQLAFTLPVPAGEQAKEAARLYLEKMGLKNPQIVWMEKMGEEFTYFVAYGHATHHIHLDQIRVPKPEFPILSFDDLLKTAREKLKRKIVVVGAATGSDAHTVGIDAILSLKGVSGDKGLEYYPIFRVVNLRAQVSNADLVGQAADLKADAILVSQLVTQHNQHLDSLKDLAKMIRGEKRLSPHLLKIVGGPRMDHRTAKSVGFDAGFGPGTKPSEVANFIVHELIRRVTGETAPKTRSLFGWLGGGAKNS